YLERGLFTEIAAPGPRPRGASDPSEASTVRPIAIRFEARAAKIPAGGEARPISLESGSVPSTKGWACAAIADVDGDGSPDLVGATRSGSLRIFRSLAGGGQKPAESGLVLPSGADAGCALAMGDADNDGDLDLFVSTMGGAKLWRNDGRAG